MSIKFLTAIFAFFLIFSGSGITALSQSANAAGDGSVRVARFGLQTLDCGRSLRLNVLNSAVAEPDNNSRHETETYRVRLTFDVYAASAGDGSVRLLRSVSRTATLRAAEGITFDFGSAAGCDGSVRVAASALISAAGNAGNRRESRARSVSATLEIRESEKTIFSLPGVIRGFDPQPDPPVNR